MASSDSLKSKRSAAKGNFSRHVTSLRNALDQNAPIATIEKRFENLREALNNVIEKHDDFIVSMGVEVSPEEENYMDSIMELFDGIEIETDSKILEKKSASRELERGEELEVAKLQELQKNSERRSVLERT